MIGSQIGVSRRIDPVKAKLLAELIWQAKVEAYAELKKNLKPWHELSNHEQNLYIEKAEKFMKFNYKWF